MSVRSVVARLFSEPPRAVILFSPEERAVAEWLRREPAKMESLIAYLSGRIEGRGLLPSSTPHEAAVKEGQDIEARQIIRRLRDLHASPLEDEGSEDTDNA